MNDHLDLYRRYLRLGELWVVALGQQTCAWLRGQHHSFFVSRAKFLGEYDRNKQRSMINRPHLVQFSW